MVTAMTGAWRDGQAGVGDDAMAITKGTKILITGGAGFQGTQLARALLARCSSAVHPRPDIGTNWPRCPPGSHADARVAADVGDPLELGAVPAGNGARCQCSIWPRRSPPSARRISTRDCVPTRTRRALAGRPTRASNPFGEGAGPVLSRVPWRCSDPIPVSFAHGYPRRHFADAAIQLRRAEIHLRADDRGVHARALSTAAWRA